MNKVILFILSKGGHHGYVFLSTKDIGSGLGMSQQNASRNLILLEKEGKIIRTKGKIMLTATAIEEIRELHANLASAFKDEKLKLRGKIIRGIGEGGYYISLAGYKSQFKKKLGFEPFPGTLNIKLDKSELEQRFRLREFDPIIIEGFKKQNRTFGDLFAYPCKIENKEGAVVIPVRTHHGIDVLELVAPVSIKKILNKKEGDEIEVEIL